MKKILLYAALMLITPHSAKLFSAAKIEETKNTFKDMAKELANNRLIKSVEQNDTEEANLALAAGANPNIVIPKNGYPVIIPVIINNNPDILEALLEKNANVNILLPGGGSALSLAVHRNKPQIVRLLLAHKAEVNPTDAIPPLLMAALQPNLEIINMLIDAGANVNFSNQSAEGSLETSLSLAAENNRPENVRILLSRGAIPDTQFLKIIEEPGHEDVKKVYQEFLEFPEKASVEMIKSVPEIAKFPPGIMGQVLKTYLNI